MAKRYRGEFIREVGAREKRLVRKGPRAGLLFCPKCRSVYFDKAWHHNLRHFKHFEKDQPIRFKLCPADQMMKDGLFEGQVRLFGVPNGAERELNGLVENVGHRAYVRDPMDRIIAIKTKSDRWEVTTTENQLAVSIGKQVKQRFKGKLEIHWSKRNEPVRVVWRNQ